MSQLNNAKKIIRYLVVFLFLFSQLIFLAMIFLDHYNRHQYFKIIPIIVLLVFLVFTYKRITLHHHEHEYEEIRVVLWVPIGALICYWLNVRFSLGAVISAGITGTFFSFFPAINKKSEYLKKVPVSAYCGAFVGMSGVEVAPSAGFIFVAGIITAILLLVSKNIFLGIGGKLGMLAFTGVTLVYAIYYLIAK